MWAVPTLRHRGLQYPPAFTQVLNSPTTTPRYRAAISCWRSAKRSRGAALRKTVSVLLLATAIPFAAASSPAKAGDAGAVQPGCSVDWQPEQSLALLPLHYVTGHRLQCMSAAIGPTAVLIGTDTVGSIRASGCASKNNAFACGLKSDRTGEGEVPGSPARHFNNRLTLGGQIAHEAK